MILFISAKWPSTKAGNEKFFDSRKFKNYLRPNDASWQTECTNPHLYTPRYWLLYSGRHIFKSATFFRITFLNVNFITSNIIIKFKYHHEILQ